MEDNKVRASASAEARRPVVPEEMQQPSASDVDDLAASEDCEAGLSTANRGEQEDTEDEELRPGAVHGGRQQQGGGVVPSPGAVLKDDEEEGLTAGAADPNTISTTTTMRWSQKPQPVLQPGGRGQQRDGVFVPPGAIRVTGPGAPPSSSSSNSLLARETSTLSVSSSRGRDDDDDDDDDAPGGGRSQQRRRRRRQHLRGEVEEVETAALTDVVALVVDEEQQRREWLEELQATVPTAVVALPHEEEKEEMVGMSTQEVRPRKCSKWLFIATISAITIAVIVAVPVVIVVNNNNSQQTSEPTTPDPKPAPSPEPIPDLIPQSSHPTLEPLPATSPVPPPSYSQSIIAPNVTENFNHFELLGFTLADRSKINKIMQIQVYTNEACVTNNDCSLPTATVISLVVTYLLEDCSESIQAAGAYTTGNRVPAVTINLRSHQFIIQIELLTKQWISHIKICTSEGECFGPFGGFLEEEPSIIFEKPNSVVKAFYGYSGSWLDALGVYFEEVGNGTTSPTCG